MVEFEFLWYTYISNLIKTGYLIFDQSEPLEAILDLPQIAVLNLQFPDALIYKSCMQLDNI